MGETLDDGLIFDGYIQPPDVPPDPTGNDWRGPPGPMGPVGPQGIPGPMPPGAPFLPLTGGTVTGPLYYTATGGNTPRSAQDRAADVANVLDFGADPTGVLDSAPAFNAAIASRPFNNWEVYIPGGTYLLRDAVTLGASCVIRGAGRNLTLLKIDTSFNMSAQGVFVFGSDPGHAGTPTVKDLWVRFTQPNFAGMTRADLIQYPPAFYKAAATLTGRPNFENLQITSAWIGFDLDNCAAYADNIFMSALSYGFRWSKTTPTLDCTRFSNVHFWGFDFLPTSPLGVIFLDGTTNCAWFGRIDGLYLVNFFSESSIITVDCGVSPAGGYYFFQQIGLDGPASIVINSNVNLQIDSISNSRGNTSRFTTPGVIINGGRNAIDNSYIASSHASIPMISVQGGVLKYIGGTIAWVETDTPFMVCSSGLLELADVSFATHLATPRTTPVISQTGTGSVQVIGCRFSGFPTASVPPISITTSANAFIDGNNYGGMLQRLPSDYQTITHGNRVIYGDATSATMAQLDLRGTTAAIGVESKLRFRGSFGAGTDFSQYVASSLRGGWTTNAWNASYLDIWLTFQTNNTGSDVNMAQVARFTNDSLTLGSTVRGIAQGGSAVALDQYHTMNAATGRSRSLLFQTGGLNSMVLSHNAGNNFNITCYDDAGAALFNAFAITRLTGLVTLSKGVAISGGASTIDGAAIGTTTPGAVVGTTYRVFSPAGPSWTAGSGAPGSTQPIGSIYMNTASPGAVGARLYVSQGATWLPVAGV